MMTPPYRMVRNRRRLDTPAGAVLWLPGQDDAYGGIIRDRSGNNNHGTITGATWVNQNGIWVLNLDGDDYIVIPHSLPLQLLSGFTISMWLNLATNAGASLKTIINKSVLTSAGGGWSIAQGGTTVGQNKLQVVLYDGTAPSPMFLTTATVPLSQWFKLDVTWDGTTVAGSIKVYFNAVNQAGTESDYGTGPAANTTDVWIGRGTTVYSTGKYGLTSILTRAKSAGEIIASYQSERSLFGV